MPFREDLYWPQWYRCRPRASGRWLPPPPVTIFDSWSSPLFVWEFRRASKSWERRTSVETGLQGAGTQLVKVWLSAGQPLPSTSNNWGTVTPANSEGLSTKAWPRTEHSRSAQWQHEDPPGGRRRGHCRAAGQRVGARGLRGDPGRERPGGAVGTGCGWGDPGPS